MQVFALVGKSGTGKSTSILQYCFDKGIPAFIDDGLLIVNGRKKAGTSAKYENNYIRAIKRATFHYDDHQTEVIHAISKLNLKKLLIVGTSVKMVDQIAMKLELGKIDHYIDVTEVRSSAEIKMALFVRKTQEKHVIPIPYVQIEPNRFKKLMQRGKKVFSKQHTYIGENTIIQPNFTKGTISIYENVIKDLIIYTCKDLKTVGKVSNIYYHFENSPKLTVQLDLISPLGSNLVPVVEDIQGKILSAMNKIVEIELDTIHVQVSSIRFEGSQKKEMFLKPKFTPQISLLKS
ncbi:hypothetical protein M3182_02005 [Mesobacillus maritimus]|uniref:hypothetical protein n=1 Tax=Mesobacillus maritimus TaxID=1643336 RepID=UPI00203C0250|nr:hypothetical protein [Mesobacillus maritimus]MCM3584516.1 hypothetical protein [Mesobacillus maritimus]MCM3670751.1 hypothetical protein [Mesobacillus maritimus]